MPERRTRCLPPGGDLETRIARGLETGTLAPGDAAEVRKYADFLADVAASPGTPRGEIYACHYPEDPRA